MIINRILIACHDQEIANLGDPNSLMPDMKALMPYLKEVVIHVDRQNNIDYVSYRLRPSGIVGPKSCPYYKLQWK